MQTRRYNVPTVDVGVRRVRRSRWYDTGWYRAVRLVAVTLLAATAAVGVAYLFERRPALLLLVVAVPFTLAAIVGLALVVCALTDRDDRDDRDAALLYAAGQLPGVAHRRAVETCMERHPSGRRGTP